MSSPVIDIKNARARISGLPRDVFATLKYELSYLAGEEGEYRTLAPDGSVRLIQWDGYRTLLASDGQFPAGLVPRAVRLLGKWGVTPKIVDHREAPGENIPLWTWPSEITLRDYQAEAVDRAWRQGRGVIDSPPRTGKTLIMAELVRRVAAKTVIVCPTDAITSQTYDRLVGLFQGRDWAGVVQDCSPDFFRLAGGPPKDDEAWARARRAVVYCATAATAVKMPREWWSTIRCLMVDERHHQAADTYREINDLATAAYWRWGFTGTNFRSAPGEQVALESGIGRTVARYSIAEMRARGVLVPARVIFLVVDGVKGVKTVPFNRAYERGIAECEQRNALAAQAALRLAEQGRRVLVLVQRIEHGQALAGAIPGARFVAAADGSEEVRAAVAALDRGDLRVLVGSPVVGEGLDCPAADALVYAKGYQARVQHTQDVFRVLTAHPESGKKDAIIVDFADRHNHMLLNHSAARLRNYVALGMKVDIAGVTR